MEIPNSNSWLLYLKHFFYDSTLVLLVLSSLPISHLCCVNRRRVDWIKHIAYLHCNIVLYFFIFIWNSGAVIFIFILLTMDDSSVKCSCGKRKLNLNDVNWQRHLNSCWKSNQKKRCADIKSFFVQKKVCQKGK